MPLLLLSPFPYSLAFYTKGETPDCICEASRHPQESRPNLTWRGLSGQRLGTAQPIIGGSLQNSMIETCQSATHLSAAHLTFFRRTR